VSIAFLFPGQGSQHVGMGRDLYESEPVARAVFDRADARLGFSLSSLCFEGPAEELTDTVNQQPALLVTSIAALKAKQVQDPSYPAFVAGHSLGEFSALVAAESLTFEDGLDLVRRRGQLMKAAGEHEPGAMAAILALEVEQVESLCEQAREQTGRPVQMANDNCPGQVVISGDEIALAEAEKMAIEAGARKVVRLPITIAAHSPLMVSASTDFARAVDGTEISMPKIPVIGNVTARPLTSPEAIRAELKTQLTAPVRWSSSMTHLLDNGVDTFVEIGPGEVLLSLIKRIDRKAKRVSAIGQLLNPGR